MIAREGQSRRQDAGATKLGTGWKACATKNKRGDPAGRPYAFYIWDWGWGFGGVFCKGKGPRPFAPYPKVIILPYIWIKPAAILAAMTVFFMSMVMVMGPTPPGTGVM